MQTLCTAVDRLKSECDDTTPKSRPYFRKYGDKILKNMKNLHKKTQVFQAIAGDEEVVVKFVARRYGKTVHDTLAEMNLAPKIHHFERLAGGWVVIAMEKIKGSTLPSFEGSFVAEEVLQFGVSE